MELLKRPSSGEGEQERVYRGQPPGGDKEQATEQTIQDEGLLNNR